MSNLGVTDTPFLGTAAEVDQAIQDIQKAISATNVSGLLLVREDLQSELAVAAPTETPLRNRLSRIKGNGSSHAWYQLNPQSSAQGLFLGTAPPNAFFARGGTPTATQCAYRYMSAPYTSLGDMVEVSFFDQMAGKSYTDVKALQIKMKMLNVAMIEEWAIINGDSSAGTGLQFDGLDRLVSSNVTDMGGSAISLTALTTTMRNIVTVGGKPQAIVLAYREYQKIGELIMQSYYRLTQTGAGALADIPAGISVSRWVSPFGTQDLIPERYIPTVYTRNQAYVIDDKSMTRQYIGHVKLDCIGGTLNSLAEGNTEGSLRDPVETVRRAA